MNKDESLKAFKNTIKDDIEQYFKNDEIEGDLKTNKVKTGYYFTKVIENLYTGFHSGYELYDDIPETRDGGVDFVIIDRKKEQVLIGQCKADNVTNSSLGNAKGELVKGFWDLYDDIRETDFFEDKDQQVKNMLGEYNDWIEKNYTITFAYFTLQKKGNIRKRETINPGDDEKATIEFEILGIEELKNLYDEYWTLENKAPDIVEFEFTKNNSFVLQKNTKMNKVGKTLTCVVPASSLAKLYVEYKLGLFALNIRQFLGKGKINKEIVETAKNNPEDFFYFNNGITAICDEFSIDGDTVTAKKLQIINGAQTVGSLASVSRSDLKGVKVLMRVVETKDADFRYDIIKSNNTQNVVGAWDFVSNDTIQIYLEKNLNNNRPSRGYKFNYIRKRVAKSQPTGVRKVTPELLSKILYTITVEDFDPYVPLAEGKGKLIDKTGEGLYNDLFKTAVGRWDKEYLDKARFGINLYFKVYDYFNSLDKDNELKTVSSLKFIIMALIMKKLNNDGKSIKDFYKEDNGFLNNQEFIKYVDENLEALAEKLLNHIDFYKTTKEEAGKKVLNPKLEVSRSKEQIKFLLKQI